MTKVKVGDIVVRKSYNGDLYFKVLEIRGRVCKLKGLDVRLLADAPIDDLIVKDAEEILLHRHEGIQFNAANIRKIYAECSECRLKLKEYYNLSRSGNGKQTQGSDDSFFDVPGRVLHLDGDAEYLKKCLENYRQLDIPVIGYHFPENDQPKVVQKLIKEYRPDILVLTGHDALLKGAKDYNDLNNYRNSKYFVEAVNKAREVNNDLDDLIIFAGACQSYYEELLRAGANFASAPKRALIHAFDPVYLTAKIAYTPINETIRIKDLVAQTITKEDGIGGVQTRGKYRLGYPKSVF